MTIQVLVDKLPQNGYQDICDDYNSKKGILPPIRKANVYEGGFEVSIIFNENETIPSDYNCKVRQLRWSEGKLLSFGHFPLLKEEQQILFNSLKKVLGNDNVIWLKNTINIQNTKKNIIKNYDLIKNI